MPTRNPNLRRVAWLTAVLAGSLACVELVARFVLGLGTPPLSETHPTIEYLFRPNQKVHRFGNVFATNRYGMRSEDFPPQKLDPHELRILVFGDSVVNGGTLSDQSRIATSIVQRKLAQMQHRNVVVGNISAGSWGPPNELAYLEQFGFLDADLVILVLSSSDYNDAPTFEPLNPLTHPTETPVSAAVEGLVRYLPRYLNGNGLHQESSIPDPNEVINKRDVQVSLSAERRFYEMAKSENAKVVLVQHWTESELRTGHTLTGYKENRRVGLESLIPVYEDAAKLRSYVDAGKNPFRDDIHLSDNGQQALAELILDIVERETPALKSSSN
jgi:hypothetical protein